jgi:hypothetical protein
MDMLFLLIKKAFFDFWDNLGSIIVVNLGYFFIFAAMEYSPLSLPKHPIFSIFTYYIKCSIFFVYTGAVNRVIKQRTDLLSASFSDFIPHLKSSWRTSLLFAGLVLSIFLIFKTSFYSLQLLNGFTFVLCFGMLFWIVLVFAIGLAYFFAFEARSNASFLACLKRAMLMLIDNPFFSLGLLVGAAIISAISAFFVFVIPGIGALLLWYNLAVRLRSAKYDYLERNPSANRRDIPWKRLLEGDMARLKSRTIKKLIFPWLE